MQIVLILTLLALLGAANGAPVLAKRVLGARWAWPLDGGRRFFNGRPVFGMSKTWRGIVASILATAAIAPLIGVPVEIGALFATAAMLGDLFSSFMKRRLNKPSSSQALGLDQVPESLFPMLVCWNELGLTIADAAATVALFFAGELLLSRLLYRLHIRDRPY
jgi:CDP-2,3-bis-(O-geranylgeranyl)-sn-glycerol synthase